MDAPLPNDAELLDAAPRWEAQLVEIIISPGHDYWGKGGAGRMQLGARSVSEANCVERLGIEGDRYYGEKPGGKAQVSFIDADVVDRIRAEFRLPLLPASAFRRNLVVRGADLGTWLGRRFTFQGVVFEGTQECKPCHWMDRAIAPGVQAFMKAPFFGGLRAKVLSTGALRVD